ncbi:heat shock protein, partial [Perkinsus olseni]
RGLNLVADAVKVTLGPQGRNVVLTEGGASDRTRVKIVNDGATIAKDMAKRLNMQVGSKDAIGAEILASAASKSEVSTGDGTSSTAVLTQYLINKGLEVMGNSTTSNAVEIKKGNIGSRLAASASRGTLPSLVSFRAFDIPAAFDISSLCSVKGIAW